MSIPKRVGASSWAVLGEMPDRGGTAGPRYPLRSVRVPMPVAMLPGAASLRAVFRWAPVCRGRHRPCRGWRVRRAMRVFGRAAAMSPSPPPAARAAVVQREPRDPTATGNGDRTFPGLRNNGRWRRTRPRDGGQLAGRRYRQAIYEDDGERRFVRLQTLAGCPSRYRFPWRRYIFADGATGRGLKLKADPEGKGRRRIEGIERARDRGIRYHDAGRWSGCQHG